MRPPSHKHLQDNESEKDETGDFVLVQPFFEIVRRCSCSETNSKSLYRDIGQISQHRAKRRAKVKQAYDKRENEEYLQHRM